MNQESLRLLARLVLLVGIPLALVSHEAWGALSFKQWVAGDTLKASELNASFESIRAALVTERVSSAIVTGPAAGSIIATATCPAGKSVISGGCIFDTVADSGGIQPLEAYPDSTTTYKCAVYNNTGANRSIQAFAICAGF